MRILIIGAGEVGYHIASRLVRERHNVVVVDEVPEVIRRVEEDLDVMVCEGHGARPATLDRAGIERAELVIAVTHSDEVNMVACLLARQFVCSRVNAEYRNALRGFTMAMWRRRLWWRRGSALALI